MENKFNPRQTGLTLRIIALILGVILIAVASATIGVIRNNQPLLDAVENADTSDDDEVGLVVIVANTLNTASWLIFLAVCVIIGEIIAVILLLMNMETGRVVLSVLEIIFSFIVAFCFLASGIACATYASGWSAPPEECTTDDLDCREGPLIGTNAMQAAICFIQTAVFGTTIGVIIYTLVQRRTTAGQGEP